MCAPSGSPGTHGTVRLMPKRTFGGADRRTERRRLNFLESSGLGSEVAFRDWIRVCSTLSPSAENPRTERYTQARAGRCELFVARWRAELIQGAALSNLHVPREFRVFWSLRIMLWGLSGASATNHGRTFSDACHRA